jgi:hypothetical protein
LFDRCAVWPWTWEARAASCRCLLDVRDPYPDGPIHGAGVAPPHAIEWVDDKTISGYLAGRGISPDHRSYVWAYLAGFNWFTARAEADAKVSREVLHAAYRESATPTDLADI